MAFSLGNGLWNGVFAVPNAVVDQHLKLASGLAAKVLLLLLRHGGQLEPAQMAAFLGYSQEDIQDALRYWVQSGFVAATGVPAAGEEQALTPTLRFREETEPEAKPPAPAPLHSVPAGAPVAAEEEPRRLEVISKNRPRLTTQEINEMAAKDENIAYLLQETQQVLGKPLTPVSTDVVAALYCYYEMRPDLILMLIQYCVSIGKDSLRYIEKVAADWLDKGIDSHEKVEAEILRLTKKNTLEGKIKAAFGIYDRGLISSEKKYIHTWVEEYGQDIPLITLAYERAIELKGKLSFPYMNGILSNWYHKGITTPAQALREMSESRAKTPERPEQKTGKSSYDIGELEKLIAFGGIGPQ